MDVHFDKVPSEFTLVVGLLVVATAVWRGGLEERAGAAAVAFQALNEHIAALRWSIGTPADLVALAVFLPLVLFGRRAWTIWALASVVLSLVTNLLDAATPLSRWSYLSAQLTWYYVLLGALLYGALTGRRPARAPSGP
jgi:hypothetical protein